MQKKKDGVADGWNLFKAWCESKGGTPIRGGGSADHVCFIGPLPDDTIDPDVAAVNVFMPADDTRSHLVHRRIELALREAKLRLDEATLSYDTTIARIEAISRATEDT